MIADIGVLISGMQTDPECQRFVGRRAPSCAWNAWQEAHMDNAVLANMLCDELAGMRQVEQHARTPE